MDSSDEEAILFSLKLSPRANQKKRKTWVRELFFKKKKEQGVYHNLWRHMSMIENHISGNLYNERFSKSSEEKCAVVQSTAWSLIVHKMLLKTTQLFLQAFSSRSLSLCQKARILLQFLSQAFIILPEKKEFLKILQISRKAPVLEPLFNKVAGLQD